MIFNSPQPVNVKTKTHKSDENSSNFKPKIIKITRSMRHLRSPSIVNHKQNPLVSVRYRLEARRYR